MDPKDLRVSDAEREHVGELLQRAVGQGMLSLGEFTERMDTVLAAKTRGDLNQVLVDLPGIQMRPELQQQPQFPPARAYEPQVAAVTPSMYPAGTGTVLKGRMSTIARKGRWEVPPVLQLDTVASSVSLDFTEAVMQTQVVRIEISDYLSSISIVVPMEATADINGLEAMASSATSKVGAGAPYGPLHLVVTGKMRAGSLTVAHPMGARLRKFLRGT
ncbi:DUF1707 domain-containing protein [Rhodococcus sp. HNM0563]|uniref:DUF1707 SHOCT-like domain-containing protein n=1 Tax=unclassified Rhodococcus (in: high G+C Gram-positive bacteria) TaxID=192944 RepID=UPI00146E9126|nr:MULTISPECIES: DUF1707 domain-containing protein [unclassified Rhodococcus (in: high G+C Gram-positive bacteria)]MCK0090665.1 DUF1707 domain-containing protein [Rhodococcus sp. F64268]NLU61859.1 DUF1707 domain-containing protein [Rhodococcus sp. HNM0563]